MLHPQVQHSISIELRVKGVELGLNNNSAPAQPWLFGDLWCYVRVYLTTNHGNRDKRRAILFVERNESINKTRMEHRHVEAISLHLSTGSRSKCKSIPIGWHYPTAHFYTSFIGLQVYVSNRDQFSDRNLLSVAEGDTTHGWGWPGFTIWWKWYLPFYIPIHVKITRKWSRWIYLVQNKQERKRRKDQELH